jgi:hypothetical protein
MLSDRFNALNRFTKINKDPFNIKTIIEEPAVKKPGIKNQQIRGKE